MPRALVSCALLSFGCIALPLAAQTTPPARHPVTLNDLFRLQQVGNPTVSPHGNWVAYTVRTVDAKADKHVSNVWEVSWDGKTDLKITDDYGKGASDPQWSPDGKYLSFLSSRPGPAKGTQVWVIDRRGGEARQLTSVKGDISDYAWSPDSKELVLSYQPPANPDESDKNCKCKNNKKQPKPIVIDRYHFKQDVQGYLTDTTYSELYLLNLETHKLEKLTTRNKVDESNPVWSPDGSEIAFVSNYDPDPDRSINTDVFVVTAKPGSTARKLTTFPGQDEGRIQWSPDGKWIAYLQGATLKYWQYGENKLGIVAADGSTPPRIVTAGLDRSVSNPTFSPDGKTITVIVEDDRNQYPARVDVATGKVTRLVNTDGTTWALNGKAGHDAVVWTTDAKAGEIYALDGDNLRELTHHNDALMAELNLGKVSDVDAVSQDGTKVHGLITMPPDAEAGKEYPMVLWIHGGPDGQDAHGFNMHNQLFAAHGYAVLNVNYRGSSGRGSVYQKAIWANWGHLEEQDLLASVDQVIKQGLVDPNKMGVGGWSYGGISTDYTIATTTRFKAASSGAGMGDPLVLYGVDEYINQYNNELGYPWVNTQKYIEIGYPFFHANRIKTPTLFMGGTRDFNVPLVAGEQMYEALRTLNVPTRLIIYPGQFHGFTRPSFIKDRYKRWFNWYDHWVLGKPLLTIKD